MTNLSMAEQLTYSVIRIEATRSDGNCCTGSGFHFSFANAKGDIPVIITNKHVIKDTVQGILRYHQADGAGNPVVGSHVVMTMSDFESQWIMHPDPNVDLCVLPTAGALQQLTSKGFNPFEVSLGESVIPTESLLSQLQPIEDIIFIGYPNGLWDTVNNLPIVRKGITATRAGIKYDGRDEFLIDAAVYPGSSGSPVFLFNQGAYPMSDGNIGFGTRVALLGIIAKVYQHTAQGNIVIQNVPTQNIPIALTGIPNGLGVVIRAEKIKEFAPLLLARAAAEIEKVSISESSSNT